MQDVILNFIQGTNIEYKSSKRVGERWVHLFSQEVRGMLSFIEEIPIVMMVKKKWYHHREYWSPRDIKNHVIGQTIPFELYNIIHRENNRITKFVFFMLHEEQYYVTTAGQLIDFVEKYGTRFDDTWNNDVVGLSKNIFEIINSNSNEDKEKAKVSKA